MYYFIVNPKSKSGRGISIWNSIKQELDDKKIEYVYYITTHTGHATKFANKICEENADKKYIIAVGGDGTANEVINGIDDYSKVIFGYIPCGSSNEFAKALKLPHDPIEVLHMIIEPKGYRLVNHGIVSTPNMDINRKYCTSIGIGLDASICNDVVHSRIKHVLNVVRLGKVAKFLIVLKQLIKFKYSDVTLITDGKKRTYENMAFCSCSILKQNCEKKSEDKIYVRVIYGMSRLKVLAMSPLVVFDKSNKYEGIEYFECSSLEMEADKKIIVHMDGKYFGSTNHISTEVYKDKILMPK